jgi:hypothetical protein
MALRRIRTILPPKGPPYSWPFTVMTIFELEDEMTDSDTKPAPDYPRHDPVKHPQHYTSSKSGVECITITEHMNFCLGNAIKYIWRADLKGGSEDLKKAKWYIERELSRRALKGEK